MDVDVDRGPNLHHLIMRDWMMLLVAQRLRNIFQGLVALRSDCEGV